MTATEDRPLRAVSDFYDEPQIAWSMRTVGRRPERDNGPLDSD